MAKIRVLRKQDKAYIELPSGMANADEVELFSLRDGYYLLSVPLGTQAEQGRGPISEQERLVLKKLLSIRFEKRVPAYVSKALAPPELETLRELERRGLVNVFRGSKYQDGVYNIKDSIYPMLSGQAQRADAPTSEAANSKPNAGRPSSYSDSYSLLSSRGFLIVMDKNEARSLSERLNSEMKSGAVLGVKGFDGKFYIVTRSYFNSAVAAISPILKDDMDGPSIASAAKLDSEGCLAVLRLMAENGEIIEKKRGVFAPV